MDSAGEDISSLPAGITYTGGVTGTNPVVYNYVVKFTNYAYNGDVFNGTINLTGNMNTTTNTGTITETAALVITGTHPSTVGFTLTIAISNNSLTSMSGTITVNGKKYSYTTT